MSEPESDGPPPSSRGVLSRTVKAQLVAFVVITVLGLGYVGADYVGLDKNLFSGNSCTVHADLPSSGGVFTGAEVTYRGVTVGRVGELHLIENGVRADLELDDCADPRIPAAADAIVADRSVIGEQYVDLVPQHGGGPYLSSGETIPMSRGSVPVPPQRLLTDMDGLINSVDVDALRTAVTELDKAFDNRGADLGTLLDASHAFLTTARQNLPRTVALLRSAGTVLSTQLDEGSALRSFSHKLNLLAGQLRTSDPDIRRLLDAAPADLDVVRSFVADNRTDLGAVIANLATTGTTLVRHLDGLTQILELYPNMAAGGMTAIRPDGTEGLGFVVSSIGDPPDCGDPTSGGQGYGGTDHRPPGETAPKAPNVAAHCTAPVSSGINVRGSANVPGGDPISTSGGGVAYPRPTTANTAGAAATGSARRPVRIRTGIAGAALLGDRSWLAILTAAVG